MEVVRHTFGPCAEWAISVECRSPGSASSGRVWTLQSPSGEEASSKTDDLGLEVWPAGKCLCSFLAHHPLIVKHFPNVIELGGGTGLVGILASLLLKATDPGCVVLTDHDPKVLEVLQRNVDANAACATVQELEWRRCSDFQPKQSFRLCLAADVLYASGVVEALANTVAHVLHPDGAFLGCHSIRRTISIDPTTRLPVLDNDDAPFRAFQAALSARGFQWQMLHDSAGAGHGAGPSTREAGNAGSDEAPLVLMAAARNAAALATLTGCQQGS
ncbi:hypothetical protein WJX73_003290 [Symbiochloris irregularis]|uniref:Uncharacterized protein n=1 Tax=Symbiochloris irregularis TaxID=706552 RepID=A0AAW1NZ83_9CHLO